MKITSSWGWKQRFLFVWQGQLVSQLGNSMMTATAGLWLTYKTNSGSLVGMISSIPLVVSIAMGLYIGAIADSYDRKKTIIFADVLSCLLIFGFIGFFLMRPHVDFIFAMVLSLTLALLSGLGLLFRASFEGIFFQLVPTAERTTYRSRNLLGQNLAGILGPNLSAFFLSAFGPLATLAFDGLSYIYGALTSLALPEKSVREVTNTESMHLKIKEGLMFIRSHSTLKKHIMLAMIINFLAAPISLLTTFMIKNELNLSLQWVSLIQSIGSGGALVTSLFLSSYFKIPPQHHSKIIASSIFGMSTGFLLMAIGQNFSTVAAGYTIILSASVFFNIVVMTEIQNSTPELMMGRVFTATALLGNITSPLAIFLFGLLIEVSHGLSQKLMLIGALGLGFTSFLAARYKTGIVDKIE